MHARGFMNELVGFLLSWLHYHQHDDIKRYYHGFLITSYYFVSEPPQAPPSHKKSKRMAKGIEQIVITSFSFFFAINIFSSECAVYFTSFTLQMTVSLMTTTTRQRWRVRRCKQWKLTLSSWAGFYCVACLLLLFARWLLCTSPHSCTFPSS